MVGRNDPCPCGSGKKYKKCCESKEQVEVKDIHLDELERILQNFYEVYPKREDIPEFVLLANEWKSGLANDLDEEMVEAIVLDEFFFHYRTDIWTTHLDKVHKKQLRSSIKNILDTWKNPEVLIGEVTEVDEAYLTVQSIFNDKQIKLGRESDKPVSVGSFLYCFLLPDGTSISDNYLAVSSLIFFPVDHQKVFKDLAKKFSQQDESLSSFWKLNSLQLWKNLVQDGYVGEEFTQFEVGVLEHMISFLEKHDQQSEALLEIVEDYLVDLQPNARKEVAIAAGAIRYGLDNAYIDSVDLTLKEIANSFTVSTSSMNKYYKELTEYRAGKD